MKKRLEGRQLRKQWLFGVVDVASIDEATIQLQQLSWRLAVLEFEISSSMEIWKSTTNVFVKMIPLQQKH